jgi:hypothetical protein
MPDLDSPDRMRSKWVPVVEIGRSLAGAAVFGLALHRRSIRRLAHL